MESDALEEDPRVTPWLLPEGDPPEREYIVRAGVDDRRHADDGLHPARRCSWDILPMEVDLLLTCWWSLVMLSSATRYGEHVVVPEGSSPEDWMV